MGPVGKTSAGTHWKIQRCLSQVLFEEDRAAMTSKSMLAIGLAQDCCVG